MKTPVTPRELLLARHAAARPALDAQRAVLLERFSAAESVSGSGHRSASEAGSSPRSARGGLTPRAVFETLWRELVAPCRGAWAGLVALWVVLFGVERLGELFAPAPAGAVAEIDAAGFATWLEQRRRFAELTRDPFAPEGVRPVAPSSSAAPKPATPAPLGFIAPADVAVA